MTPVHAIIVVIIRLWAAGFLVYGLVIAYEIPFYLIDTGGRIVDFKLREFLTGGIWFAMGLFAWVSARWLARLAYPTQSNQTINIAINPDQMVAIGSFLIGGYYFVQYFPPLFFDIFWWLVQLAEQDSSMGNGLELTHQHITDWHRAISNSLVVAFASCLMFRPDSIAYLFSKLRRAGLADVEEKK